MKRVNNELRNSAKESASGMETKKQHQHQMNMRGAQTALTVIGLLLLLAALFFFGRLYLSRHHPGPLPGSESEETA